MVSEMGLLPPGTGGLIVAGCGRPLMDDPHLILRSVGAACFGLFHVGNRIVSYWPRPERAVYW